MSERPEDWARVKAIFVDALSREPDDREDFLEVACGGDGALRARVNRLLAAHAHDGSFLEPQVRGPSAPIPDRIGPYRLVQHIGEGGMGVVFEAYDERLARRVALKLIHRDLMGSVLARERFQREARVAAGITHPNVCQIYDIGGEDGLTFLAMERLEGESLADRLLRGALPFTEAVTHALGVLSALDAMHRRGVVHRDLKPSNVFLTPYGVKLLDFGLARSTASDGETYAPLTLPGTILGTPRYMAPEQIRSADVDERADLFALSVILYEMLSGVSPFAARSLPETLEKILHAEPPMIAGSAGIVAVDRVIHRGLAKAPGQRYPTAEAMAQDLRAALQSRDDGTSPKATAVTRLIVLPFRLLKPDREIDFLAFGLADAIASSLSAISTLVVRSSLIAARFGADVPDLATIGAAAQVDVVVVGSLIRSGTRLRVTVQLLEAPGGRVIWSENSQLDVGDLFQLQDDLTRKIVESLALPLSGREQRALARDVPANAQAYEFFLRGTQLSRDSTSLDLARDMFKEAVRADPQYAPAWAKLGHVYRVLGKYRGDRQSASLAESSLNRALELNPDSTFADRVYAQIEVDYGRSQDAMVRLLRRASVRANDPDLFAGLVHSCRYCGLFEASIAAHERARRLDPNIRTSLQYTLMMAGHYDRALAEAGGIDSVRGITLAMLGHPDAVTELQRAADEMTAANMLPMAAFVRGVAAMTEGNVRALREAVDAWIEAGLRDPEALFIHGLLLAGGGENERGLELMLQSAAAGYTPYDTITRHRWLDALRERDEFKALVLTTRARYEQAAAALAAASGIPT